MAQSDLMARIEGVIRRTIEARLAEGDKVEWSTVLVPTYAECEQGHVEYEFIIGMYARTYCPEIETTMVSNLMNPMGTDEEIAAWINGWWDSLTVERMSDAMGLTGTLGDEVDTPEG